MKNVIGIDLGTTNCCVAIMSEGRPKVIEDEKGYNILPSYIAIKGPNKFIVGHAAKSQAISNPRQTLRAVKRLIGRKINTPEVEQAKKRMGFDIIEGPNYDILLRLGESTMTAEDASSILLKCIKGIAAKYVGEEVTEAVITCPAYFTNAQRKSTIASGEKAGLRILRLLNEPTAAALAYGYKKDLDRRLLIYDLGGGTFDVSVLEVGDNVYEVLATNGDSYLGGEDFDNRIVDHLAADFKEQHDVDLREEPVALQRLKDAAERAKCELSFVDRTQVMIPHVHGTSNLQVELTRDILEALAEDLVKRTFDIVVRTLEEANLEITDVDEFILVGGQTRMPRIQEMVKSLFGKPPCKGVHPDEAVAIGACVHADALTEDKGDLLLLDVTPFALGIDSAGDIFTQIVAKNSTIPVAESRTFTTVIDNQEKVKIVVRQGENKRASENKFLGEFVLTGIRRAPKMEPKIDVVFRIDSNGILNVSAKDRFTGERQSIVIRDYFERATNPEHEAAPLVVPDEEQDEGEDVEAPQPVAKTGDGEKKAKRGLLSRLVGGIGKGGKKKSKEPPPQEAVGAESPVGDGGPEGAEAGLTPMGKDGGAQIQLDKLPAASSDKEPLPPPPPQSGPPSYDPYGVVPMQPGSEGDPGAAALQDGDSGDASYPVDSEQKLPLAQGSQEAPFGEGYEDPFALTEKDSPFDSGTDPFAMSGTAGDPFAGEKLDPYAIEEKPTDLGMARKPGGRPVASRKPQSDKDEDVLNSLDLDKLVDELQGKSGPSDETKPAGAGEKATASGASTSHADLLAVVERGRGGDGSGAGAAGGEEAGLLEETGSPMEKTGDTSGAAAPGGAGGSTGESAAKQGAGRDAEPNLPRGFVDEVPGGGAGAGRESTRSGGQEGKKRKPARLKIAYRRVDAFVTEYSENLGRGGTFIKTPKPLELGRECIFELTIPNRESPIVLKGVVVWSSKHLSTLEEGQEKGMGIKYVFEDDEQKSSLGKLLDELRISG